MLVAGYAARVAPNDFERRKSLIETRTALLSVVVTGVVGLAGVFATVLVSRDGQDTARQAQRETMRTEQEQADLAELRSVLDRAAADLERLRVVAYRTLAPAPRRKLGATRQELELALRAVQISGVRLLIRLGARADAVDAFLQAQHDYDVYGVLRVSGGAAGRRPSTFSPAKDRDGDGVPNEAATLQGQLERGDRASARFSEEARELVGSRLPD